MKQQQQQTLKQEKKKVKEKVEEVYPIKNTLLNELRNEANKKYILPECLTLTYKKIEKIEEQGIPDIFASIPYIHLSHNKISSLKGIQQFKNLQGLSISHNLLPDWTELLNIEDRSQIQFLRVRRNPLCKNPNYHSKLLEAFSNLEKLDDVRIDEKCHQVKYQTQHSSQPLITQLFKVLQIEFEKIEIKLQGLYPHLFDDALPTSQKIIQMQQIQQGNRNTNANAASTNNILGDLNRQKTHSFINSNRASALTINQQNQSTNRSHLGQQGNNTSISVNTPAPIPLNMQFKSQVEEINFDFFDHLIAFLNNDPTLKLKKSAGSILLGGFFLRLWKMLGSYMLDPFYKNMMNIYDVQIDLFSRIMKKYRERHDHSMEQYLQQQCELEPQVDKERLFSDLNYGYACFFHEFFKLSEPPAQEEYEFTKDYLGIVDKSFSGQDQDVSMNKSKQPIVQQNQQQQSTNQIDVQQQLQGIRPTSQQQNLQTFVSQMSQSIVEEYNKEQKKVNQQQNQFKNQSDLSPKNVNYFANKNEQYSQLQQNQTNTNQAKIIKANQQADLFLLQNYFPLFLLNQDYMEVVFECVVEKLVAILHGYEILMYGELDDDDEVFYKFQNVQKIFTIYNPQEEIYKSIQNIGKQEAINQSRLANQSRTKSERSINNMKRRQSENQSALSNKNNVSQNQKSRVSNRQLDVNTSSYVSQSKTNMSVRSGRQPTHDSLGSRKTLQQQQQQSQKDRSQSVIDQLNNTLTRLSIKKGHSNSLLQNRSALNLNQNSTFQQLQSQQQNNNITSRSHATLLPDLSPINQITNPYITNILNTSQNQTAGNMSREQIQSQNQQLQNYQTLPLTDYSPLAQQGNMSVSQNYQSLNVYDQAMNSPFNIQQHTHQTQEDSPFSKAVAQNSKVNIQESQNRINTLNNGSISHDDMQLQDGQVGTSYFMTHQKSKDSSLSIHQQQSNQQQSFSKLQQSKSAGNVHYLSHSGQHIGQFNPSEYNSYKEYVLRQQLPWGSIGKHNRSIQRSQYFVTILKNILQLHTAPLMKKFFFQLKLASDRKLQILYDIMQRRMKLNAFKFWTRQVRKETKNNIFNLMILQKFFMLLRKNVKIQRLQAERHSQLQIKYKVFFGLVKILRNKRKIKKGLRKIRRLVLKKAVLPVFQKLTLFYLTIPKNHTIQEINYNKIHQKSKELFKQLSIHFKIEDDYKTYKYQQQNVILDAVKSQIEEQAKKDLQIRDSFKIAQEQIDILNHQSRIQPESGVLLPSKINSKSILTSSRTNQVKKNDEDNKRTLKSQPNKQQSTATLSTIPKDKTLKQNKTNSSKIINTSRK